MGERSKQHDSSKSRGPDIPTAPAGAGLHRTYTRRRHFRPLTLRRTLSQHEPAHGLRASGAAAATVVHRCVTCALLPHPATKGTTLPESSRDGIAAAIGRGVAHVYVACGF